MRVNRRGRVVALVLVSVLVAGCSGGVDVATEPEVAAQTLTVPDTTPPDPTASTEMPVETRPTTTTTEPTTTTLPPTTIDPMVVAAATMTLEDLVGQVLMIQLTGTAGDDASSRNLQRFGVRTPAEVVAVLRPGGVMLLGENTPDVGSVADLTASLQAVASSSGLPGLTISVDQEGGRVNRLRDIERFPSARQQLASGAVEAYASSTAASLRSAGINVVLGPVADVTGSNAGVIGDRAYSGDPAEAADAVGLVVTTFETAGVGTVVKHWPGHGRTSIDSHVSLPTIEGDLTTWTGTDRPPFAAAVDAGVDAVMLGHLAVPAIDPTLTPATVSPLIVGALRDGLGFDGIVMTDSLQMGALAGDDPVEVAIGALVAGVDVLLDPAEPLRLRDALVDAVDQGRLDRAVVERAVVRILEWKASLDLGLGDAVGSG